MGTPLSAPRDERAWKENEKEAGKILEEIMAESFPDFRKTIYLNDSQ